MSYNYTPRTHFGASFLNGSGVSIDIKANFTEWAHLAVPMREVDRTINGPLVLDKHRADKRINPKWLLVVRQHRSAREHDEYFPAVTEVAAVFVPRPPKLPQSQSVRTPPSAILAYGFPQAPVVLKYHQLHRSSKECLENWCAGFFHKMEATLLDIDTLLP